MALTANQIWEAADKLEEAGESPTLAAVRRELGGGSYTTISEAMQQWRTKKQRVATIHQEPVPEAVVLQSRDLIANIWQTAKNISDKRLETERKALEVSREQMEQESREAAQIADQLSTELEKTSLELATEKERRITLESNLAKLIAQAEAAKERMEDIKARLLHTEQERDAVHKDLNQAISQAAELKGNLAIEAKHRKEQEESARRAQEKLASEIEAEKQQRATLESNLAKISAQADANKTQLEELQSRMAQAGQENQQVNQALQKALNEASEIKGKLASEIERRDECEKRANAEAQRYSEQIQTLLAQIEKRTN